MTSLPHPRPTSGAAVVVQVLPVPEAAGRLDARPHPAGGAHQGLGYGCHAEGLLVTVHDLPHR